MNRVWALFEVIPGAERKLLGVFLRYIWATDAISYFHDKDPDRVFEIEPVQYMESDEWGDDDA